jgi:succinoglycan biosynthesis transport protein ExoP
MADNANGKAPSARNDNESQPALPAHNQPVPFAAWEGEGEGRSRSGPDPQATLRHLWNRRRSILLTTVAGAALAYAGVSSIPPLYTGEARVLLGLPAPRVLNVEAVIADISPDAERVQNESFIVQSRSIAAQVIDDLHLDRKAEFNPEPAAPTFWSDFSMARLEAWAPTWLSEALVALRADVAPRARSAETQERDRLIDRVLARLDVAPLGRSHLLSIKAESRDPALAAAIANSFAERYLAFRRDEKLKTMDRVDAFLMQRISELREQVNRSEQAVEDYRRTHALYKSGTGSLTAQQLSGLNTQLLAAQTAMAEAEARLAEAKAMREGRLEGGSVPEVLRSPTITALKSQLAAAERRSAEVSATYGQRHPQFKSVQAEQASLAGHVAAEVAKIVDGLARDANTARARHAALTEQFEELKTTMGAVNDKSIHLEALERDAAVDRKLLEAVLSRAKQSTGTADILQAGAKLVSAAPLPDRPSYPPKTLVMILGALLGFLAAAAVALLRETGNRTFRRPEQIESMTGLPVLTMIPAVASRTVARRVLLKPLSPYSEAVRRLSVGIALSNPEAYPRRLLFSSAIPGEGKSIMVASLARQLAADGKSVIVIDADWRRPRMHGLMRCPRGPGLGELLADSGAVLNDCVHRDGLSSVDVIASGNWDASATHLLTSPRMGELLKLLAENYDAVLVDAPPVLATADALMLSRMADKVVYVLRWGHTHQDAALSGLRQLVDAGADVAGIAMSRVEVKEYRRHSYREVNYARPAIVTFR